jgi:hypothetical protein
MASNTRPTVANFEQAVAALFTGPTFFLHDFTTDPETALENLRANPARFGHLPVALGRREIEKRLHRVITLGARLAKL